MAAGVCRMGWLTAGNRMVRVIVAGIQILLFAGLLMGAGSGTVKIMPLGDSITEGASQVNCYRYYLDSMLSFAGYTHDLVGSLNTTTDGLVGTGYQPHHEGHWGFSANQILPNIGGWGRAAKPDIVLMHVGTNDITSEDVLDSLSTVLSRTISELGAIIDTLRSANPSVTIFLAQIIPGLDDGNRARFDSLNVRIPALATAKSTTASKIIVVDQNTGFNYLTDLIDNLHPNANGAKKMAAKWFAALDTYFKSMSVSVLHYTPGSAGNSLTALKNPFGFRSALTIPANGSQVFDACGRRIDCAGKASRRSGAALDGVYYVKQKPSRDVASTP
jgi:acyl-CoA thioesterase I